jgi:membrane complex biogenesis BtpA family protein
MRPLFVAGGPKALIGLIHLRPLPGTPYHQSGSMPEITATAVRSALALREGGADGCLVQTVDRVYSVADESDPARTVAMGLIVNAIVAAVGPDFHVGAQLMRNAVRPSLATAKVAGGTFIRATALVGMTLSPHGMVRPDPLAVMEYRKKIDAEDIALVVDVDSPHYQWFGEAKPVGAVAHQARLAGAHAVAVGHPDEQRTLDAVAAVRAAAPDLPIILAGFTNHENAVRLLRAADGAFVGGAWERAGWGSEIDAGRVAEYVATVRAAAG